VIQGPEELKVISVRLGLRDRRVKMENPEKMEK
jgi:hypothetical protein